MSRIQFIIITGLLGLVVVGVGLDQGMKFEKRAETREKARQIKEVRKVEDTKSDMSLLLLMPEFARQGGLHLTAENWETELTGEYLKSKPLDAWNHSYRFTPPETFTSAGPDGEFDTADDIIRF